MLGEVVFVGGCTTTLFITDKTAAEVRPTYDVDAIAEISSYAAYADFSQRLRKCGFTEDTGEGALICRWRQKKTIARDAGRGDDCCSSSSRRCCRQVSALRARQIPGVCKNIGQVEVFSNFQEHQGGAGVLP